jgi:catechol 2,3-dioxygenase-like lactoylglutathione lyase family enzyme
MHEYIGSVPFFCQIKIAASDFLKTLAFYRMLGLVFEVTDGHASAILPNGTVLEVDAVSTIAAWDSGWDGTTGGSTFLGFSVDSPDAVDRLYHMMCAAGWRAHLAPHDAPWGRRLAIINDPDDNPVSIMGPRRVELVRGD